MKEEGIGGLAMNASVRRSGPCERTCGLCATTKARRKRLCLGHRHIIRHTDTRRRTRRASKHKANHHQSRDDGPKLCDREEPLLLPSMCRRGRNVRLLGPHRACAPGRRQDPHPGLQKARKGRDHWTDQNDADCRLSRLVLQIAPQQYNAGIGAAFSSVVRSEGASALFAGLAPTTLG